MEDHGEGPLVAYQRVLFIPDFSWNISKVYSAAMKSAFSVWEMALYEVN